MIFVEQDVYKRGIFRFAPIKESIDTANLLISNLVLGYELDTTVSSSTQGDYYINTGTEGDPIYTKVSLPNDYVAGTQYYKFNKETSNLLEPITDIVDICGINPSEFTFSKNTTSSEQTGRVLQNLNMQKDILGRIWDTNLKFSILSNDKLTKLDNYFMSRTDTIEVTENEETTKVTRYVIWFYMEALTPVGIIKDLFYVGDSSFTQMQVGYRLSAENGLIPYAKDVNINLIGKSSIGGLKNSDYSIEED